MPVRIDYVYYPFLCTPREHPRLFMQRPSLFVASNNELRKKLTLVLRGILEKGEIQETINDQDESILIYYTVVEIVKALKDGRLVNKVSLSYSKHASRKLNTESNETLIALARRLGLSAEFEARDFPKIPLVLEKQSKDGKRKRMIEIVD
ncbi:MAG: hypothetical protein QXE81_04900, partial [Desulfurococcaceae archaeon]